MVSTQPGAPFPAPRPGDLIAPLAEGPLLASSYGPRTPEPHDPWQGQDSTWTLPADRPQPQPNMPVARRPFRPTLPARPSEYASFWRTPAWSWWRPVVAAVLALIAAALASVVLVAGSVAFDVLTGRRESADPAQLDLLEITAALFLANNLALASLIPISFLVSWLVFRQRPGWLASVVGTLRWGWLARCLLIITPLWLVYLGLDTFLALRSGALPELSTNGDTLLLAVGILLTTPLQAAGEEYGFRGTLNRIGASFFANQRAGWTVGALLSSLAFMFAHAAADPWLNMYYFSFGMVACFVTWRTGGLEGAIAMHVVNNVLSEALMPLSDIGQMFNREAGTAGPSILIGVLVLVVAAVLISWQGRKRGLATASAPGESMAMALAGAAMPTPIAQTMPTPIAQTMPTPIAQTMPTPIAQTIPTPPMPPPPMLPKPRLPKPVPPPGTPNPPSSGVDAGPSPLLNPRPWESERSDDT